MNIPCKYLQGNNVNEGRKLHQVSEDNRKRSNGHKQRKKKFSLNMSKTLRVIRLVKNSKVAEVQLMHIFKKAGLKIKKMKRTHPLKLRGNKFIQFKF